MGLSHDQVFLTEMNQALEFLKSDPKLKDRIVNESLLSLQDKFKQENKVEVEENLEKVRKRLRDKKREREHKGE